MVQALRTLGKEHITDDVITKLQSTIDSSKCDRILKDTKTATDCVYEVIKRVCK